MEWIQIEDDDCECWESPCGQYRVRPHGKGWTAGIHLGSGCYSYLGSNHVFMNQSDAQLAVDNGAMDEEFEEVINP